MPCDSRIVETKLFDAERIKRILGERGDTVESDAQGLWIRTKGGINLFRQSTDQAFQSSGATVPSSVNRAYAEAGVRAFATRRGYSVTDKVGNKITLTNRRK